MHMASPVGLEPTTCGLEVRCSVRLSYRDALSSRHPIHDSAANLQAKPRTLHSLSVKEWAAAVLGAYALDSADSFCGGGVSTTSGSHVYTRWSGLPAPPNWDTLLISSPPMSAFVVHLR